LTLLFFGLFAFSLLGSFVATREVRDLATSRGWVSVPRDGRHVHRSPLPRLGGVAIFLAFSVSVGVWLALARVFPRLVDGLVISMGLI
jgi:UDP-GlcNAc:undecaprenyl-phosphate GlcNAc-1-phosphate transferase